MRGDPPYLGTQKNIPLEGKITYLRSCQIAGHLYDLGEYPALVETHIKEGMPLVQVELYEVLDTKALLLIDKYESYYPDAPELSYYLRKSIQLVNEPLEVWCYFYNEGIEEKPLIESGCWRSYSKNKKH